MHEASLWPVDLYFNSFILQKSSNYYSNCTVLNYDNYYKENNKRILVIVYYILTTIANFLDNFI